MDIQDLVIEFNKNLFLSLEEKNVDYTVLRGYENLPAKVSHDLDIYIFQNEGDCFEKTFQDIIVELGAAIVKVRKLYGVLKYIILVNDEFVLIDVILKLNFKSFIYSDAPALLRNKKNHNDIDVLKEGAEAAVVLMKELLMHKKVKSWGNAYERLVFCVDKDEAGFCDALSNYLSEELIIKLVNNIKNREWKNIELNANEIRYSIIKSNWKKYKFRSIIECIRWFCISLKDRVRPCGFLAAVIGPDGSGKTTLVNEVCSSLEQAGHGEVFIKTNHLSMNFKILPNLSTVLSILTFNRFKKRNDSDLSAFQGYYSGMQEQPNSKLRSIVYILWYTIDLCIGHFVVRKKKASSELMFFARYYYDYYYQRNNMNAPKFLLQICQYLVPKPDLVFYIDRDAEDIFACKPELSLNEIKRQQGIIQALAKTYSNFRCIDGSVGIDGSTKQIVGHIVNELVLRNGFSLTSN